MVRQGRRHTVSDAGGGAHRPDEASSCPPSGGGRRPVRDRVVAEGEGERRGCPLCGRGRVGSVDSWPLTSTRDQGPPRDDGLRARGDRPGQARGTRSPSSRSRPRAPDLWDDPEHAQEVTSRAVPRQQPSSSGSPAWTTAIDDLEVLVEMGRGGGRRRRPWPRPSASSPPCSKAVGELEVRTLLDGEYDEREAVVTIRSGAGGVDAADFAEMLMRMYLRWAERHGYPTTVHGHLLRRGGRAEVGHLRGQRALRVRQPLASRPAPTAWCGSARSTTRAAARPASPRSRSIPLIEQTDTHRDPRERDQGRRLPLLAAPAARRQHHRLRGADDPHPDRHRRVDAEREVPDPEPRRRPAGAAVAAAAAAARPRRPPTQEGDGRRRQGQLGRPDALLRAAPVPDGQGPAHRATRSATPPAVFDGDIDGFIEAGIRWKRSAERED